MSGVFSQLPERLRETYYHVVIEEMDEDAAARLLGVSIATIRSRLELIYALLEPLERQG